MEDLLAQFLPQFCKTALERIQNGLAHIGEDAVGHAKVIISELHTLAGEAAMLGLSDIATTARTGEQAAKRLGTGAQVTAECARAFRSLKRAVDKLAPAPGNGAHAPSEAAGADAIRKRVLVVDDSALTAGLVCDALDERGFESRAVSDEDFSVDALMGFAPDVVLTDVHMPHLDSAELCAAIRRAQLAPAPIVLLVSGMPIAELEEHTRRAGADGCVSKESGLGPVIDKVRACLAKENP